MPSLTFVLPHWLYWSGLLLFPLAAMYIVRRPRASGIVEGAVNLPTAYLFWVTAGFVGIHRFYVRSWLGIAFIPLFVAVLYGNAQIREAREGVSSAHNQISIAEFDIERAQQALQQEQEGAAARLEQARTALEQARGSSAGAEAFQQRWQRTTAVLGIVIALLLLIDAALLPGLTRRTAAREAAERAAHPPRVVENPRQTKVGRGHPADHIQTAFTRGVDLVSGYAGEVVSYWSLLAVFAYYYEVVARYVFNSPTNWAHESMFLMFGMQYLLSGAYALREDAHVRVDVVYLLFRDRAKAITNVITSVFFFLFNGALLWSGYIFAQDSMAVWEVSFTEWAIQYWPVKLTLALGALLILAQGTAVLMRDLLYLRGRGA